MSRYLGLFVAEASEHLEALGRDLVALEGTANTETVDSLFRHAHSVKGMAASMGLEPIAQLAHRVEDLVDVARRLPGALGRERVDLLLTATDSMLALVRGTGEGNAPAPQPELLGKLGDAVVALTGQAPRPTKVARVDPLPKPAAAALGVGKFEVRFRILEAAQSPGPRAFLVYKKLTGLGAVTQLRPSLEDLRAGAIPDGRVALVLETDGGLDPVRSALALVPEVELISAEPVVEVRSEPPPAAAPAEPARTVRVRTELLDDFLEMAGELLLATARLRDIGRRFPEHERPALDEGVDRLHSLVKDLHGKVMGARMTPVAVVTDQLPRAARDLARKRGKDVEVTVTGAEIEIDRAILDAIAEPLLHVLRNAVDHGIEAPGVRVASGKPPRGRLAISVRRTRERVVIELEDDGKGMDPDRLLAAAVARGKLSPEAAARLTPREALLLACLPGVSTATDVDDVSGRGVGMDAVKRSVESLGGAVELDSQLGRGTRITLRLPLTVAVVQLLLVRAGGEVVGLPITKVLGAVELPETAVQRSPSVNLISYGTQLVPAHDLARLLALPAPPPPRTRPWVVMESEEGTVALGVEALLGQEEAVLKALSRPLDRVAGLAGVTILGNGRPVFILDVPRLLV
ncbi:MAG TPA: chemotaxis protein CheA [Myxococcaceae bacterium]|jgi:two-component system chemotaxis sensor kinase CheA